MPKKTSTSEVVSVRLSNEVMIAVCKKAIEEGENASSIVRKAVSLYVGLTEGIRANSAKAKLDRLVG